MSKLQEAAVALRTVFRAPVQIPREFDRLLNSIGDVRAAAAEARAVCAPDSIAAVIACTDQAGDFGR